MADYEDPLDAANRQFRPTGVIGSNQPFGQTDVWHDRGWLLANIQRGPHDRMAHAAEIALGQLNRDEALGQRDDALALQEANLRRNMAHDQAELASKALRIDRETSIDEQGAALMTGLGQLDALHRNGRIDSDQFDAGLLDLGQQYQLGIRHPVAGKMFDHFITEADKRNAFNVRRLTSETARLASKYGVEPQVNPDTGLPSIEYTRQAALQTDKGKQEFITGLNKEMLQKYGVPTGVSSLFNPIAPHESPDNGKTIDLPYTDRTGKVQKLNVPAPLFNQMKSDFNDRYFSVIGSPNQAAQPKSAGLEVGATRNVGGKNYSWNGQRWEPQ